MMNLIDLRKKFSTAKVVSFDFFDTLFLRSVCAPEDVFDLLGKRFDIPEFRELRIQAQAEAFRQMHLAGLNEINLQNIYDNFAQFDEEQQLAIMQAEYEMELSLVHLNPELNIFFRDCLGSGKPIVITSDMYLPDRFFADALNKHGINSIPFFVSSSRDATKRDRGELFDHLIAELKFAPHEILHIGDNKHSDVEMARRKGLEVFHYSHSRPLAIKLESEPVITSVTHALQRTHAAEMQEGSPEEIGYRYGGPAIVGYFEWLKQKVKNDKIDVLLFFSRDGYVLSKLASLEEGDSFPRNEYFMGSRTAFTLAAINESNFKDYLPYLVAGSQGLSPCEILERIGVPSPHPTVLKDLGYGLDNLIGEVETQDIYELLFALKSEILKICRRNRRGLFNSLVKLGIHSGTHVGLVDVGWRGTTQEAFEIAAKQFFNFEVFGYYFCLAGTLESKKQDTGCSMQALLSHENTKIDLLNSIYSNRVAVEVFFSAPHDSVIGYDLQVENVIPIEDKGRGRTNDHHTTVNALCGGMILFAKDFFEITNALKLKIIPSEVIRPLLNLVTSGSWKQLPIVRNIKDFDAWSSTRNRTKNLLDYDETVNTREQ